MILPSYSELVQRDQNIPGLKILFDLETLKDVLTRYANLSSQRISITNIRYTPNQRCLVNYTLHTKNNKINIYAKAHKKTENSQNTKIALYTVDVNKILIPSEMVSISFFPHDKRLNALNKISKYRQKKELISRTLPDRSDLWEGTFHNLIYLPEKRLIAKLVTNTGAKAVMKFCTQDYQQVKDMSKIFYNVNFNLQKEIGHCDEFKTIAFEWIDGEILTNILINRHTKLASKALFETGISLAYFHLLSVQELYDSELISYSVRRMQQDSMRELSKNISLIYPEISERVHNLTNFFSKVLKFDVSVKRVIHGDFSPKNVILTNNDKIVFLDVTECMLSNPIFDLSKFISYLYYLYLTDKLIEKNLSLFINSFLDGYKKIIDNGITSNLKTYVMAELFTLLRNPFKLGEPDWKKYTERITQTVESGMSEEQNNKHNCKPNPEI